MPKGKIVVGSDHAGLRLKKVLSEALESKDYEVLDVGAHSDESVDYPDFAKKVAEAVTEQGIKGVLVCGTGQGMGMTANRFPGVRAAVCSNAYQVIMARAHNDANVLCMGERVIGEGVALHLLDLFLETEFEGGRHQRRVDKIETS
jgi:ribose 5-phosphate isomerase B